MVNGVANHTQASTIKAFLDQRTEAYESQPTRWSSKDAPRPSRYYETWYGRLGVGDVLMRFRNFSEPAFGLTLMRRIASAFVGTSNIMESYTQAGAVGTDAGTDYLEHCGGFLWSVLDGPFGVDFDSDSQAAATIAPQFDPAWGNASAYVVIRGVNVSVAYAGGHTVLRAVPSAEASGAKVVVRLTQQGKSKLVTLASPN